MKQLLLFLSITLLGSQIILSQAPTNIDIQNATQINNFPYSESNIRLDLAAVDTGGQNSCNLLDFETVYYKFTATNNGNFNTKIEDASNLAIGNALAIIYIAPSINATTNSELTLISACAYGSNTTVAINQGINYYIIIHRSVGGSNLSNITFEEVSPVPTSEQDALIALYNSTNGDSWSNKTNWKTNEPISTWHGVTTEVINGVEHVTKLALGGNNLTGVLPAEIGDFPELTNLWVWTNQLTGNIPPEIGNLTNLVEIDLAPNNFTGPIPTEIGNLVNLEILWLNQNGLSGNIPTSIQNLTKLRILYMHGGAANYNDSVYSGDFPDLTALPLEILWMHDNFFQFTDIVDEFATYQANIPDFRFNPQYTVDAPIETNTTSGSDITLTLTDVATTSKSMTKNKSLVGNTYQWYKDDVALTVNANTDTYVITNAQVSDSGVYYCEITNTDVPGMAIRRQSITLNVGALSIQDIEMNTINIYPNPISNILNIKLNNIEAEKATFFDVSGKQIIDIELKTEVTIADISNLSSGIYLLKIITPKNTIVKRIIKK